MDDINSFLKKSQRNWKRLEYSRHRTEKAMEHEDDGNTNNSRRSGNNLKQSGKDNSGTEALWKDWIYPDYRTVDIG